MSRPTIAVPATPTIPLRHATESSAASATKPMNRLALELTGPLRADTQRCRDALVIWEDCAPIPRR
jgi:hypothetical protein